MIVLNTTTIHQVLKINDEVKIFTDYKEESGSTYEGTAILLEQLDSYADSFYLASERLIPVEDKYNSGDVSRYLSIHKFFSNPEPMVCRLRNLLLKHKTSRPDMIKSISEYLTRANQGSDECAVLRDLFNKHGYEDLVFYIEQLDPNWQPTIYHSELWKVEFITDKEGWPISFITTRKIRVHKSGRKTKNYIERNTVYKGSKPRNHIDDKA